MEKIINQYGKNPIYIEKNIGEIYINTEETNLSLEEINRSFNAASVDLSSYNNLFGNSIHIPREETALLYRWISNPLNINESPIAVLAGNAGCGKSVILKDLYDKLNEEAIPVLGIKADRLAIHNLTELNNELALGDNIESIFKALSGINNTFILIIDQIDALSQSLSSDRNPLQTYNRLILALSHISNIRIIISCRLYDLDYDPLLQEYKKKKVFRTTPLSLENVDQVLSELKIPVNFKTSKIKEFLTTPLHLQLFSKIKDPAKFEVTISLQSLYDEIWRISVLEKPRQFNLDSWKVQNLIDEVSDKMYDQQQLVVSKRVFENRFTHEINYLSTEEILAQQDGDKLQFLHQSFFDYAYARIFIEKGVSISESLKSQHQGLFIRSRVKQVFTYLRELDEQLYIRELTEILLGEYRFHLKLLLLNNLGFYSNPLNGEKNFIKKILASKEEYLKLFFESIHSEEWFDFCLNEMNLTTYFRNNNKEIIDIIYGVCWRMLHLNAEKVIDFLEILNGIEFDKKSTFISNILRSVPPNKIDCSFELFLKSKGCWDLFNYYHYLRSLAVSHPDLTIIELNQNLDEYLEEAKKTTSELLPGGYDGFHVYEELYNKHPNIAIPFFIKATEKIAIATKIVYIDEVRNKDIIFESFGYYLYAPFRGHHYNHQKLYDKILTYLEEKFENNFEEAKEIIIPLLSSDLAMIVNLPITYMAKYPNRFRNQAFQVLSSPKFYNTSSEHIKYNLKKLIESSYSLFTEVEQQTINQILLNISPQWEKKNLSNEKGVSKYGYTRIGLTAYGYIAMIPELERKKHKEINQFYKEKNRQYGESENKAPQGVEVRVGDTTMPEKAYEKMSNEHWKESFKKYTSDRHFDWNIPTRTGHSRMFEEYVSKEPYKYVQLIDEIIEDKNILPIYSVYGLQGLKKGNYEPERFRELFVKFVKYHYYASQAERESLIYAVWIVEYFIETSMVDNDIIDFLSNIVLNYEDGEMLNNDPITDGINSVRGAASLKLIQCYTFPEFKEEIFSTLEAMASKGAVHTRGAALYQLAYLNNLDKERNLDLYLALMHDYNPLLLKIPLNNIHPLVYLIHVDFQKLLPFFRNAIMVDEAKETMAHVLFIAWLYDYKESKELLDIVLSNSLSAQIKVVTAAFDTLKNKEFAAKCWEIIHKYLSVDDEEMGRTYEFGIHDLHNEDIDKQSIENFLDKYVNSVVGKYRGHYFYELLLKNTKDLPRKCIEWVLSFNEHEKPDITKNDLVNEPLQIIIQSYNAIREYNKDDSDLESAIDTFDEMLKVKEYRAGALDVLEKIDA